LKFSKDYWDLRKQEKAHFTVKDYEKAEKLKRIAD
jgi:hypothetical protein